MYIASSGGIDDIEKDKYQNTGTKKFDLTEFKHQIENTPAILSMSFWVILDDNE